MAKESRVLTWSIFFAIFTANRASQEKNESLYATQFQSAFPRGCFCSPCPLPEMAEFLAVQCNQINLEDLMDLLFAHRICSLDLSRNNIKNISLVVFKNMSAAQNLTLSYNLIKVIPRNTFKEVTSLKYLFLDHNKIEVLTKGTFNGLAQLEYLNLAYNKLRKWEGALSKVLPKLQFLNITGNRKFKLKAKKDQLLRDTALKTILGATTTSKDCVRCNFSRTDVPLKEMISELTKCEYIPPHNMPLIYQFQKRFPYFKGTCGNKSCEIAYVPMKKVKKTYRNYCMDKGRSLRPIEYFLGIVAMVFNLVVIVTILCNRCLIKKTSMFLTAQLAFGDLLLAVFSLTIANGHGIMSYSGLRQWRHDQCPYFRTFLILGQSIEAFTSALMTLERYLAIVYCMKPNLRISSRSAYFICAFIFIISGLFCFAIEHFDHPTIRENYMCVLIQDFRTTKRILASQILMLFFVGIYLAVLGMYIHIFISVRKSGQSAGIKRESALAKRISIIVFSNMLFYAVPNLSLVVFSAGEVKVLRSDRAVNFIIRIWLPPMCMIANACLNPFLFAFKNEQFLTSLKEVARIIIPRVCLFKRRPSIKQPSKRGLYVVSGANQRQNVSQLTLNESIEFYRLK